MFPFQVPGCGSGRVLYGPDQINQFQSSEECNQFVSTGGGGCPFTQQQQQLEPPMRLGGGMCEFQSVCDDPNLDHCIDIWNKK